MSKNEKLWRDEANQQQRFSIRKLTVGTASVLLGTLLFWGSNSTVKADAVTDSGAGTPPISKNQQQTFKVNQNHEINNAINLNDNKAEAKPVSSDAYHVTKVQGSTYDSNNQEGQHSYESLHVEMNISDPNKINAGDYIDIDWGIPYKDDQNNEKVKPFDSDRFAKRDVTYLGQKIGEAVKHGDLGYRLIFNQNIQKYNNVQIFSDLQWATWNKQASANTPMLSQYTNDKNKNGQDFSTTIPNDVVINGQKYSSQLPVHGQYVYNGIIGNQLKDTVVGPETSYNARTWSYDTKHLIHYDTNWNEEIDFTGQLEKTGHDLTVTVTVPNNHYWNYDWVTEDQLKQEIKDSIAFTKKVNLHDAVINKDGIFVSQNDNNNGRPDPGNITVQRTINESWKDPKRNSIESYLVTYHINIPNKEVLLNHTLRLLTVSHSGFTLPATIKDGNDEYKAACAQAAKSGTTHFGDGNWGHSGVTNNLTLMKSLENTLPPRAKVVNNENNQSVVDGTMGNWIAQVSRAMSNENASGGEINVKDMVNAHLTFKDDTDSHQIKDVTPSKDFYTQDATGKNIDFASGDNKIDDYYSTLTKNGYKLDKVVLLKPDGTIKKQLSLKPNSDQHKLSSYDFGSYDKKDNSNATSQMEFVVYLKKVTPPTPTKEETVTLHYVDVSSSIKDPENGWKNWKELGSTSVKGKIGDPLSFATNGDTKLTEIEHANPSYSPILIDGTANLPGIGEFPGIPTYAITPIKGPRSTASALKVNGTDSTKVVNYIFGKFNKNKDYYLLMLPTEQKATLHFIDATDSAMNAENPLDPTKWKEIEHTAITQDGKLYDKVSFKDADKVLSQLEERGYIPVKTDAGETATDIDGHNHSVESNKKIYTILTNRHPDSLAALLDQRLLPTPGGDGTGKQINDYNLGTLGSYPDYYFLMTYFPKTTKRTVTETIHYVFKDKDGNVITTPSRDNTTNSITFNGTRKTDLNGYDWTNSLNTSDPKFSPEKIDNEPGFKVISAIFKGDNGQETSVLTDADDGKYVRGTKTIDPFMKNIDIIVTLQKQPNLTDTKKVTETIHYVFQDEKGNKLSTPSRKNYVKTLTFNGSKPYGSAADYTYKNDGQSFAKVAINPETGFKVISAVLNDKNDNPTSTSVLVPKENAVQKFDNINHNSNNISITVTLRKIPKPAEISTTIHYRDVENVKKANGEAWKPTDGSAIDNGSHDVKVLGHVNDKFSDKLWNFDPNKWVFVDQSPAVKVGKLTKDTPSDLYVYLKHQRSDKKTETKTIHETIHYISEDGQTLQKDPEVAPITFTRNTYTDKVSNQTIYGQWDKSSASFPVLNIPTISGYSVKSATANVENFINDDKTAISKISVTPDSKDVVITIVYKPADHHNPTPEKADVTTTIHYIDVSNSKKTTNFTPTDGQDLKHDISESGKDGDNFPTHLWNYPSKVWTLAAQDAAVSQGKLTKDMPADLYVYLKKVTTKPEQPDNKPDNKPEPSTPNNKPDDSKPQNKPSGPENNQPAEPNTNTPDTTPSTSTTTKKPVNTVTVKNKVNVAKGKIAHNTKQRLELARKHPDYKQTLPQTGSNQTSASLIGLAFAGASALFGLAAEKKRKN